MVDGNNFAAEGTPSELRKRNVNIDDAIKIENKVSQIRLINFYNTSGEVQYGLAVVLECEFESGDIVTTTMDGVDYLSLIKKYSSENGTIWGDFLFLFQGVVTELVEVGSKKHLAFRDNYEKQELKKQAAKSLEVNVGDIVDSPYNSVFLGEYFYPRPNLKNDTYFNQPRKYRLYSKLNKDGDGVTGLVEVESGKSKTTKVLGEVNIDFETLTGEATERMTTMFQLDIGYTEGYMNYLSPKYSENNSAYILTTMVKDKKDLVYPTKQEILDLAWLCRWDEAMVKGKFERITDRWDREPIKYKER